MADPGSRVDWGGDKSPVRGGGNSSFSSLLRREKSPRSNKNNNKATGFVVRNNGGNIGQKTISGTKGLHITKVDRRVNTNLKQPVVVKGGGVTRKSIVQAKADSVRVRPEN